MSETKGIQNRIKSVTNTKKVTKAMEMVAAAKMRKAIDAVLRTRSYANLSWETILRLSRAVNDEHPLLSKGEKQKEANDRICIILFTSNRGLCGGFNAGIVNKLHKSISKQNNAEDVDLVLVGKKGISAHNYYKYNVIAEFSKPDIASGMSDVVAIAKLIMNAYLKKEYSKVIVAYTDFVNAAKQEPRIKQILPMEVYDTDINLGEVEFNKKVNDSAEKHLNDTKEYIFEPSATEVLNDMIPRLIEVQIFQALLESNASEHSARMTAMHQATDAASDMISELTLTYNKIRQASITAEIAEIGAGVDAMK